MIPLIYVLQNGGLNGFERMALATLDGLSEEFAPYLFAPDGEVIQEAQKIGISTEIFASRTELARKLRQSLAAHRELVFLATDHSHSYSLILLNAFYRRKIKHLHLVGGADDLGKKKKLNKFDVTFVVPTEMARERLISVEARQDRIRVIENFLTEKRKDEIRPRRPFDKNGVRRVLLITRLEPEKKVGLLLDALDSMPELNSLEFTIFGGGSELARLRERAAARNPNVVFRGVAEGVENSFAGADLFLHLCPVQTSGQSILEALAARLPILVADSGGIGSIISHNVNGFCFRANDAGHLAERLRELSEAPFDLLNAIARGGNHLQNIRFSSENSLSKYRRLIWGQKIPAVEMTRGKLIL
ncbi:MAG: glycosyltransferase family 4 protein [Acidobacteria bacterium]|nr:glycosyltransferase family 4 protein [Acidobacteriota bacterium]